MLTTHTHLVYFLYYKFSCDVKCIKLNCDALCDFFAEYPITTSQFILFFFIFFKLKKSLMYITLVADFTFFTRHVEPALSLSPPSFLLVLPPLLLFFSKLLQQPVQSPHSSKFNSPIFKGIIA